MCAGAFKADVVFREGVEQDPIRFHVAIATSSKLPLQGMIPVFRRERITVDQ